MARLDQDDYSSILYHQLMHHNRNICNLAIKSSNNLLSQASDADSQILSHEPSLDGLDAHCFKRLAEGFQLCVVVQLCSVQQATCPGKDGGCDIKIQDLVRHVV